MPYIRIIRNITGLPSEKIYICTPNGYERSNRTIDELLEHFETLGSEVVASNCVHIPSLSGEQGTFRYEYILHR